MRWNEVITLISTPDSYQDDEGGQHEGEAVEREIYCDVGMIGTMTMAQLRSSEIRITGNDSIPEVGLRQMHVIYIRQIDYQGEQKVRFHGKEMDVIGLTSDRSNYKMIVRERLSNIKR